MKKKLILYVEDDFSFAKKYVENFEENGFLVTHTMDGQEAIRLFTELSPDIAVLDIRLSDQKQDGFWIAKQIRRVNKHIPILFLTAIGDEETAVKGFEVGGDDFIRKGVGKNELLARVNRAIQNRYPVSNMQNQKIVITTNTYLDLIDNALTSNGHTESLSKLECELLQMLVLHKNDPQDREYLMKQIWSDAGNAPDYMNKAVCKLRKLLSHDKKIKLITKRKVSITLFIEEN